MAGSRKQTGGKAKDGGAKKKLPAALAKRVESEVAAKKARLAVEARADIELIVRRRARIAEDFTTSARRCCG